MAHVEITSSSVHTLLTPTTAHCQAREGHGGPLSPHFWHYLHGKVNREYYALLREEALFMGAARGAIVC